MRIGVNTLFMIPGEVGGSETYLVQTLLAIAENHTDTQLVLFTNLENDVFLRRTFQRFAQISFQSLSFHARNRPHRILREQLHLPLAVHHANVDVLWSPGYTAPLFGPCPQVVSILDMQYKSHPEDMTLSARLATDILVQQAARRCRSILTISKFSRSEILKHTAAAPEQIHVAHLAAAPDFSPSMLSEDIRAGLSNILSPGIPYLLCVANTYPHKNVAALVRAFGSIQNHIPNHLVLVGKPRRGEPEVLAALGRVPEPARVHRLQDISRAVLIALYQCADLFIFPSLYEGFGLPVLEAMTAGTPVLTTRHGSIPEVGGKSVSYFTPGKKDDMEQRILEVLRLPAEKRQKRIFQAHQQAKHFSWRRTAQETMTGLHSALSAFPPRSR